MERRTSRSRHPPQLFGSPVWHDKVTSVVLTGLVVFDITVSFWNYFGRDSNLTCTRLVKIVSQNLSLFY